MDTTLFLNDLVNDAMGLFSYYRQGPVPMHKLQPGFIFQQCIDQTLEARKIVAVECGLGDHCLPDLGLAIQLKTTVQDTHCDRLIFCRSSVADNDVAAQKQGRRDDVEDRIYDMYGTSDTSQFVLVHVNLTRRETEIYNLHDGNQIVGTWLDTANICSPHKQTHFWVKTRFMQKLA